MRIISAAASWRRWLLCAGVTETVIGVDGCPGGWIAAIWHGAKVEMRLYRQFADILTEDARIMAVDMPIGLPTMHGRAGEPEARRRLKGRHSSIFAIPSRAAIAETDYRTACAINLKHSDPPRKFPKQTFNLFPKLRELDVLMTPELQALVHETHPELAFCAMNDFEALKHSKKTAEGAAKRLLLLKRHGVPAPSFDFKRKDAGRDDVIDACACAWSARRILEGKQLRFPAHDERDERGLLMRIEV